MDNKLTEKEELLLVKYSDNECGLIGKFLAKRLISARPEASEFFQSLTDLSAEFQDGDFDNSRRSISGLHLDLWDRISARIEQEEKAEFYLGTRNIHSLPAEGKKSYAFSDWSKINFGIGSGLAAAAVALFFTYGSYIKGPVTTQNNQELSYQGAPDTNFQPVNLNNSSGEPRNPVILFADSGNNNFSGNNAAVRNVSTFQSVPKIDWLRSHGKVRMIKDSASRLPIIWVNRNLAPQLELPNHTLFDGEDNINNDTPVIINEQPEKFPTAISVSDIGRK